MRRHEPRSSSVRRTGLRRDLAAGRRQAESAEAERDYTGFWGRLARENLLWSKPFTKVLDEYKKAPDVTRQRLYLETMERVFGGIDKVIIDQGNGQSGVSGSGVVPVLPLNELIKKPATTGGNQ